MKILLDENFNNDVLRGVLRMKPDADIVRVQDIPAIAGADDPTILAWAAENDHVVFTHDVQTMTKFAYDRVRAGQKMPGLFEVRRGLSLRGVIDDTILLIELSKPGEWEGQVRYFPLT